jgi:two-component system copper resistance phosphate regulon response regulator CusR
MPYCRGELLWKEPCPSLPGISKDFEIRWVNGWLPLRRLQRGQKAQAGDWGRQGKMPSAPRSHGSNLGTVIVIGIRILVIEDEDEIADFLVRGLREEGFTVERSADGEDGWHHLKTGTWDAVLLDWWLPGTDGLALLRRFRQIDQQTPVLFLTARDAISDRVRGLDNGADDYLCKPFAFEELLARIRVTARRQDHHQGTVLSNRGVQVDLANHRVERAGNRLDLTAKEHSLLVFFLRHPGEILTRTRIYEHVWDERYDGLSNTLEVHVMELRRKLEMHGPRLIHTLRNRGYVFGEEPN